MKTYKNIIDMSNIYKLTKDGKTILPATSSDAVIDPKSNEALSDLLDIAIQVNTSATIDFTDNLNITFTSDINGKDITEDCTYIFDGEALEGNTYSDILTDFEPKQKKLQTIYKGRTYETWIGYRLPMSAYYGVINAEDEINEQTVLGLNTMFCSEKKATFRPIKLINQRFVYAYPAILGELTDIKDINGFDYLSGGSFGLEVVSVNGIDYNVYHLQSACTVEGEGGGGYGYYFY